LTNKDFYIITNEYVCAICVCTGKIAEVHDDNNLCNDDLNSPNTDNTPGHDNIDQPGRPYSSEDTILIHTELRDDGPVHSRASDHARGGATESLRIQIMALFQVSDSKLALKLFGNRNAVLKEKQRQNAGGTFVIHPCSDFRFVSTLLIHNIEISNVYFQ